MAGRADDFGAGPAVCGHDLAAVEDVLNGVLSLPLFDDGVRRNSLGEGECGHGVGLDEVVMGGAAGEDDMWSGAGLELANAFESALALLRRRGSIQVGRCAKNDD